MKEEFESRTEESAIRRIGYARTRRNNAVTLRNAPVTPDVGVALRRCADDAARSIFLPRYRDPIERTTDGPYREATSPRHGR